MKEIAMTVNAVVAFNPQQMALAQSQTITWITAKLEAAQRELAEVEAVRKALVDNRIGTASRHADRMERRAKRRVIFYEKVKQALEAGYYIIPPFDIQLFAIRTDASGPHPGISRSKWTKDAKPSMLPAGEGRYVSPEVTRVVSHTETVPVGEGKTREVDVYRNWRGWDDVDLPVRALKPTIIEAVGEALERKVFDALGIAPAYRAADPLIAGQIHRHEGSPLTFFVAWWLDEADL